MNDSRTIHHPLQMTLFGLVLALPLGCDPSEAPGPDGLADVVAALDLSPSQDLLELEEADAVAFDAEPFDLEAEVGAQASGAGCTLLRPVAGGTNRAPIVSNTTRLPAVRPTSSR